MKFASEGLARPDEGACQGKVWRGHTAASSLALDESLTRALQAEMHAGRAGDISEKKL